MYILKQLFLFYISPSREELEAVTTRNKIFGTLKLLLLNFFILIFFGGMLNSLLITSGVLYDPIAKSKMLKSLVLSLFSLALLGPVIEELTFRIWLVYTRKHISIAIGAVAASLIFKFCLPVATIGFIQKTTPIVITLLFGAIIGIVTFYILKKAKVDFKKSSDKTMRILAFTSSLIFGYLHLFNYKVTVNLLLLSPLFLANYIIGGLILSFIRLRYGLSYAIISHMIYNAILVMIKFSSL